ncbi:MAG: hypothetical protein CO150_09870 [Nitrospirae bacterium CG_4_9_14_3_um_filter_53_35]|nr:MAG: hypothetical protein AUK29_10915 [Nitrospirae bacterium CG2_30_53_67]PIS37896.1 MAG: hypothetical protein COT35_03605 [Nitrospirae bacterium CG08_land_8_20_14_0_20_52_24]PIV83151.1 MAG: hypothetical protein COW52_09800 [Nitrospirae bacterium CG17_big_fil_post_rev_8_21_14_2_50_50_9]PIX85183.1 MAG: hypothetical protein COZ32_09770 [Nitrospirae bacterium CG_4_10_14_3_um_filter_53_41]PJA72865.1 MAG: hypothetical protein CO150_09870 [Nitrospirae bacterium CG_4_9_14_3_um_filter_53_35]
MRFLYSLNQGGPGGFSGFFILQGSLLILLGVLILLFPALLQVMVAAFFILIGILVLGFGLTIRKIEKGRPDRHDSFYNI